MRQVLSTYKMVLLPLFIFLAGGNIRAQSPDLNAEYSKFESEYKDSLGDGAYLDSVFMGQYSLTSGVTSLKSMRVWNNPSFYDSKDFIRICDIRWKFKSNAEAEAFHKKFIIQNAENGEEITDSRIKIDDVSDLRIFREGAGMRKMMNQVGTPMNFYYFLFVVDKYVAKVFVCTKPNSKVKDAYVFAREAARKLVAYSKENK